MDLQFTTEELAFRDEVRGFLKDKLPEDLSHKVRNGLQLSKQDMERWHAILNERGWLANHWPEQHGGPGWSAVQKFIFEHECALAGTPRIVPFGLSMLGPVLIKYGNEAQKAHWLPRILNGADWWCQGYSEPGSGSDLASLRTKAVRDGSDYIVNGQKTWTTMAQHADWGFFLVRTNSDVKQQEGISFLLIDMKSPGITVRPIITLGGEHEVNEVWLEDVRVPQSQRVYEEDKGWTCAKFLLAHERTGIAGVAASKRGIERVKSIARTEMDGDRSLLANPFFKRKVAELEMDLTALEFTELRSLAGENAGKGPGPESSLLKIKGSEIQQRLTELSLEAVGHYGAPYFRGFGEGDNEHPIGPDYAHRTAPTYFNARKTTIYGGSNEIQRNIIAKMVLGL